MNAEERQITNVLRWTVNHSLPAPPMDGMDEDDLVDLAHYHRILQPLLSRLEEVQSGSMLPRLRTRLRIMQHRIKQQTMPFLSAALEISQKTQARGLHSPIFVKGFAAYALTDNPALLHLSSDIDVFAEDLPALWDTAHTLGYTGKRKDTHEWAKLKRQGMTLDVHQSYPVPSYPDDVRTAPAEELDPTCNPGHWHLPTRAKDAAPEGARVQWADLRAGATPGIAEGTRELLFPAPAMLCLIYCAHCFRNAVMHMHYINPLGGFRLYELLSIQALTHLPNFDANQFDDAVERFSAHDAVCHVNTLAKAVFGKAIVPQHQINILAGFPEHLIYGGWVSLRQPDDFLVLHGIEKVLDRLDANQAPACCTVKFSTVPRLLLYGEQSPLLPQADIVWDEPSQMLTVDWTLADDEYPTACDLTVYFGYGSSVRVGLDAARGVKSVAQKSDYLRYNREATAVKTARNTIRVVSPIPAFPSHLISTGILPLLLAIRKLSADGISTRAASYLPLRLYCS